jgi:hypothetical protein
LNEIQVKSGISPSAILFSEIAVSEDGNGALVVWYHLGRDEPDVFIEDDAARIVNGVISSKDVTRHRPDEFSIAHCVFAFRANDCDQPAATGTGIHAAGRKRGAVASFCSWAAVVAPRDDRRPVGGASSYRAAAAVASIFFRVQRPGIRAGPAIAVTTRFRARSRTFFPISGIPIPEDPIEAQRRPGRGDLPTEVFHRRREVSVQPRAAGTPNEPDDDAVADRSDRSQRRRAGEDRPTEFSAVRGVCPRTTKVTRRRPRTVDLKTRPIRRSG